SIKKESDNLTNKSLAQTSLNKAIHSILKRISIPYKVDGLLHTEGFFQKLSEIAAKHNARIYVYGGVARSLLSYIYAEIYKKDRQKTMEHDRKLTDDELLYVIKSTLVEIIAGVDRKKYDQYYKNRPQYDPKKPEAISEEAAQQLLPQLDLAFNKQLKSAFVLGVGSDLDIGYIANDDPRKELPLLEKDLNTFIHSARNNLIVTSKDEEIFIASFMPNADIKHLNKQREISVNQGGSSLDWWAFPLYDMDNKSPDKSISIELVDSVYYDDFINGVFHYLPPKNPSDAPTQKQTFRSLRALLELPFLKVKDETQLRNELEKIGTYLALDAQEQLEKAKRNARFGSGNNRLIHAPDGSLEKLIQDTLKKANSFTVQEFAPFKEIATRTQDKGQLKAKNLLMEVEEFRKNHTVNGALFHGTPDTKKILSIARN
ncbi:MAG: hypothetical protein Q8K36_00865, partial [Alphaproteobacteria bacterium]|nr:hypothetical protein [Alphaproteobacteria bacterium]